MSARRHRARAARRGRPHRLQRGRGRRRPSWSNAPSLLVSLGGDGTMLRTMRLLDRPGDARPRRQPRPARLPGRGRRRRPARRAVGHRRAPSTRSSRGWPCGTTLPDGNAVTAFNDIALVRVPGDGLAAVAISVEGAPFVRYAADAVIVVDPDRLHRLQLLGGRPDRLPERGGAACGRRGGALVVQPGAVALRSTSAGPATSCRPAAAGGRGRRASGRGYVTAGRPLPITPLRAPPPRSSAWANHLLRTGTAQAAGQRQRRGRLRGIDTLVPNG